MGFREEALRCLGRFPARCRLDAAVITEQDKGSHILQAVEYNVEEGDRVRACLLLPKGMKGRLPAIVASHQHNGEYWLGKSEPSGLSANRMYHYGLELCLRRYVVICPDHLCFEDRRPPEYRRMENDALQHGNYERLVFTKYLMEGSTLQAKYLSDLMAAIDLLQSLDAVDPERIGAIGHSLGGQETLWLAWMDGRIKAAVSSCGFSQISTIIRDCINHNFAMYAPGLLQHGDIADVVCGIAPRPFFMANGASDGIFPVDCVRQIARQAEARYGELAVPDHFRSIVFDSGHSFPDAVKEQAYGFLDRYLNSH